MEPNSLWICSCIYHCSRCITVHVLWFRTVALATLKIQEIDIFNIFTALPVKHTGKNQLKFGRPETTQWRQNHYEVAAVFLKYIQHDLSALVSVLGGFWPGSQRIFLKWPTCESTFAKFCFASVGAVLFFKEFQKIYRG